MSKFQESLIRTAAMRSRVPRNMRPLFDHLVHLAKDSHRNPLYAKRAGRELAKARRLANTGYAIPLQVEPFADVWGSEGIMGTGAEPYELPPMAERVGGPYELPLMSGCAPPPSVAGAAWPALSALHAIRQPGARPANVAPALAALRAAQLMRQRQGGLAFGPARSMRNLTAIAGASYAIECAGYEAAHDMLVSSAGAMIAGWPAGSEFEVGFFGSIVKAVKKVGKSVGKAVSTVTRPIAKTVSSAAKTLVDGVKKYNPVAIAKVAAIKAKALAGDLVNSTVFKTLGAIASKALAPALSVIKNVAGPVLPYVQSVLSFVPGVGTGISAALGAAQALADGRRIDEAIVAAAKSAIPGGPLAATAFDAAWGLAHGRPIESVALEALRNRLPNDLAKKAFDTGLALATAKTAQDRKAALGTAALGAIASNVPVPTALVNVAKPALQTAQQAQRVVNTVRAIAKNPVAATAIARAAALKAAQQRAAAVRR